ncbi:fructosamine kinase family protein [Methylomonas sp. SURF-2]|uniref:Fructosamine kinase family protein n=1 Tax=Methylomonas subterranea TaxID=2952225 RepID=A0ABT1TLE1_9GAMM|nr:fructosamine kinase family protein [Methylomonas sp. SURF-2]MCQ8105559.1 fructosamine kinase family protein [Methylomonas sp. SURF-2]
MTLSADLLQHLQKTTGQALRNPRVSGVGGGDINAAYRLQSEDADWFVKTNRASLATMFAAEAAGLQELTAFNEVRVPKVIDHGQCGGQAYLVLEYLELTGLRGNSAALFGEKLARLHTHSQPFFGWHIDNTIGSTPQSNAQQADWIDFWQKQRLGKQLQIAENNGFGGKLQSKGEKLLAKIPAFFSAYRPHPSLLHGDLWGGNAAADQHGNPVMFDPACYYGDREADIAMTELFGGFGGDFYAAYQAEYPLDAGYPSRKTLYNLYHILNHLNLFGSGYQRQAENMMDRLLAELG